MKRFIDILRFSFISLEFLSFAANFTIYSIFPDAYAVIGAYISNKIAASGRVSVIIIGLLLAPTYHLMSKTLFPKEHNRVLLQWPNYQAIKDRCYFVIFLVFVAVVAVIYISIYYGMVEQKMQGFILMATIMPSMIGLVSLLMASFKIRELIEKHDVVAQKNGR